jgi:hypothetical protein
MLVIWKKSMVVGSDRPEKEIKCKKPGHRSDGMAIVRPLDSKIAMNL